MIIKKLKFAVLVAILAFALTIFSVHHFTLNQKVIKFQKTIMQIISSNFNQIWGWFQNGLNKKRIEATNEIKHDPKV